MIIRNPKYTPRIVVLTNDSNIKNRKFELTSFEKKTNSKLWESETYTFYKRNITLEYNLKQSNSNIKI